MALWELDEFKLPELLGYVRDVPPDPAFTGQNFLPNRTINDLVFEYIKGVRNKVVMAHVMAYDAEAPIEGLPGLGERVQGELPPIKRKAKIGERELIRFMQPRLGTDDRGQAIGGVYDLVDRLLGSVQSRVEWLRLQALSEDTIIYDEDGVTFAFDYGIDPTLQIDVEAGTDGDSADVPNMTDVGWDTVATANPLADLQAMSAQYEDVTGYRPALIVFRRAILGYLQANTALHDLIRGADAPSTIVTRAEIQNLFDMYELPQMQTYDAKVTKENADGTQTDVYPLGAAKSFLLPAGGVGNTLWGPTAESRALIGTPRAAEAPGVIAVTYATEEPPAEWVKAAGVAFPSMPDAHLLMQATLYT